MTITYYCMACDEYYASGAEQLVCPACGMDSLIEIRREAMSEHKCDTCVFDFPTCEAKKIVWSIDIDPYLRGGDADKVLECDAYVKEG